MMTIRSLFVAAATAMVMCSAHAAPSITINSANQRYPWNNLADVNYTVSGLETGHHYKLVFEVVRSGGEKKRFNAATSPTTNGTFTTSFDISKGFAEALERGGSLSAFLMEVNVLHDGPEDATGTAIGALGDVMVVDVSAGVSATTYPVEYYADVDMGKFNCSLYKTDKIVLRKVVAGEYAVGYPVVDYNLPRTVTTAGFYIGLFPVTQKQYMNVCGSNPSICTEEYSGNPRDERPVENVSWRALRGSIPVDGVPEASASGGFIARLLAKARRDGESVQGFDLPTAFQWEIACRAGTSTRYDWGEFAEPFRDHVWNRLTATLPHAVGRKLPNAWGLYDMCGNVWELCRDALSSDDSVEMSSIADQPLVVSSAYRVLCGGCFSADSGSCVPHKRKALLALDADGTTGFRLYCPLP